MSILPIKLKLPQLESGVTVVGFNFCKLVYDSSDSDFVLVVYRIATDRKFRRQLTWVDCSRIGSLEARPSLAKCCLTKGDGRAKEGRPMCRPCKTGWSNERKLARNGALTCWSTLVRVRWEASWSRLGWGSRPTWRQGDWRAVAAWFMRGRQGF